MHALDPTLSSIDVQATMPEINLRTTKLAELGSTEPWR